MGSMQKFYGARGKNRLADFVGRVKRTMTLRNPFQIDQPPAGAATAVRLLALSSALMICGCAQNQTVGEKVETPSPSAEAIVSPALPSPAAGKPAAAPAAEQVRANCIAGRRLICGKILKVTHEGLVVESGYTSLLRPPLTESWIVPATVSASRNPAVLELNEPGAPCMGLVFLTDIPKRPKPEKFDYVIIIGYPAGEYDYTPVPNVTKTIRKFSAGLDTAVKLTRTMVGPGSGL
jgi:hypothetical protein